MAYLSESIPIGTIIAWSPGYFSATNNGGSYVNILGNTISSANSYLSKVGYVVCNGDEIQDSQSPIFFSSGRFIPNLTDQRFLSGSSSVGALGGLNEINSSNHSLFSNLSVQLNNGSASWNITNLNSNQTAHSHGASTYRGFLDSSINSFAVRISDIDSSTWTSTVSSVALNWVSTGSQTYTGLMSVSGNSSTQQVVFSSANPQINCSFVQPYLMANDLNNKIISWNNKPTYLSVIYAMRVK
jgi:hypothetical protein